MNIIGTNFAQSYAYPGVFFSSEQELKEDWLLSDPNREIEEEKLQQSLESFLTSNSDKTHQRSITEADTLLSWLFYKTKKRIETMKKVIEENWNGNESFKQIEKLENGCLNYLKGIFNILDKLQKNCRLPIQIIDYVLNNQLGFEELLFYSDNLEVNYYVVRIILLIYRDQDYTISNDKVGIYAGNLKNYNVLLSFYNFFLEIIRFQYPYSIELFKQEKFFKDIGHKPETQEMPSDQVKISTAYIDLNCTNGVKKDFGEYFLSVLAVRGLLDKVKNLKYEQRDHNFLYLVFSIRVAKNLQSLKQRTLVFLNMVLASQAYKNKVFPIVEGKKINIHYSKELRHFVAIKGFPLQEYYLELLEIISSEKLFHDDFYQYLENEKQDIYDIQGESRFVDEMKTKIEEDLAQVGKKELSLQIQTLNIIIQFVNELSYFIYTKNNADKLREDIELLLTKISQIIQHLLINYAQSDKKQEILSGLVFLLNAEHKLLGDSSDKSGAIGGENNQQLWASIWEFFKTFYSSTEPNLEFSQISFSHLSKFFENMECRKKEFKSAEFIQTLSNSYSNGNKAVGNFAILSICSLSLNFLLEQQAIFHTAVELITNVIYDNNFEYQTNNCRNLYLMLEKYIEIFESKNLNDIDSDEYQVIERTRHLIAMGFTLFDVYDVEKYFVSENQFEEEDETKVNNFYYEKERKNCFRSLKFFINYFIDQVVVKDQILYLEIIQHPARDNPYSQKYFGSILCFQALKTEIFISRVLLQLIKFKEFGKATFYDEDIDYILEKILYMIHPCQNSNSPLLTQCLAQCKESFNITQREASQPEKPILTKIIQTIAGLLSLEGLQENIKYTVFEMADLQKNYKNFNVKFNSNLSSQIIFNFKPEGISRDKIATTLKQNAQFEFMYLFLKNQLKLTDITVENLFVDDHYISSLEKIQEFYVKNYLRIFQEKLKFNISKILMDFESVNKKISENSLSKVICDMNQLFYDDNKQSLFYLSKFFLSKDFLGQRMKESGKFLLGLPHRLNSVFGHHRLMHLVEKILQNVAETCLKLIPDKIDDTSLENVFKSFIQGVVADNELRKCFKNKFVPISQYSYFEKMKNFLRSCHGSFQKYKIYFNCELDKTSVEDLQQTDKFLMHTISSVLIHYKNNYNKALFASKIVENSGQVSDYHFSLKMILDVSQERFVKSLQNFLKVNHELICIELLFIQNDGQSINIFTHGSIFFQSLYNQIIRKSESITRLEDKIRQIPGDSNQYFKDNLSQRLNSCQVANGSGVNRLCQMVDGIMSIIFQEIVQSGIIFNEQSIQNFVDIICNQTKWVGKGKEKVIQAQVAQDVVGVLSTVFRQTYPQFDEKSEKCSYLLNYLQNVFSILPNNMQYANNVCSFVKKLKNDIQNYPPLNSPILINFFFSFIHKISKQWIYQIEKPYHNRLYLSDYQQYLHYFEINSLHFDKTPSNIPSHFSISLKLLKQLGEVINDRFIKILPTDVRKYSLIIPYVLQLINSIASFANTSGFFMSVIQNKDQILSETLGQVVLLLNICINKLKDFGIIQKQYWDKTIDTVFKLLKIKCLCKKVYYKCYSSLWLNIIRIIDVLFVYQKQNFLQSNYEIRLKGDIFDPEEKRYKWTFTHQELSTYIKYDMLENPLAIYTCLESLIESFDEDPQSLKKLIDTETTKMKKRKRNDGDGEEEEEVVEKKEEEEEAQKVEVVEHKEVNLEEGAQKEVEEQEAQQKEADQGQEVEKQEEKQQEEQQGDKQTVETKKKKKKRVQPIKDLNINYPLEKLKLKELDKYSITSTKILQLSSSQRQWIDSLVDALKDRVIICYDQAKAYSEKNEQVDDNLKEQKFILGFSFIIKSLTSLVQKYPLIIPYILEKKLTTPKIGLLKTDNYELSFLDYILIISVFTHQELDIFVDIFTDVSYCFFEESKNKYILSSWYYSRNIFDRALIWMKKLAERTDFLSKETNIAVFSSLSHIVESLLRHKVQHLTEDRIKQVQSFALFLFKKANTLQELDLLNSLNITEILSLSLKELMKKNFHTFISKDQWNEKFNFHYIQYFLNKNFVAFFEKENRETYEKLNVIDYQTLYSTISVNSKQNLTKILQCKYEGHSLTLDSQHQSSLETLENQKYFAHLFQDEAVLKDVAQIMYSRHNKLQQIEKQFSLSGFLGSKKSEQLKNIEHNSTFYKFISHYFFGNDQFFKSGFYQHEIEILQNQILSSNTQDKKYVSGHKNLIEFLKFIYRKNKPQIPQQIPESHSPYIYHQGHQDEHVVKIPKKDKYDYFENVQQKKEVYMEDSDLEEILEDDFWRVSYSKKIKNQNKTFYKDISNNNEQQIDDSEAEKYGIDVEKFKNANNQQKMKMIAEARQILMKKEKLIFLFFNENFLLEKNCGQNPDLIFRKIKEYVNSDRIQRILLHINKHEKELFLIQLEESIISSLPREIQDLVLRAQKKQGRQKKTSSYDNDDWVSDDEYQQNVVQHDNMSNYDDVEDPFFSDEDQARGDLDSVYTDNITEDYLTRHLLRNPELEQNLDKPSNLAQLVPTFDDEFIQKFVLLAHLFRIKESTQLEYKNAPFKHLIDIMLLNPFNAYKFIDCIQFLLVSNILPKIGFESPLIEKEIYDTSYNKGGIVSNKRDNKLLKTAVFFDILEYCMDKHFNLNQLVLFNYPLQKEDITINIDEKEYLNVPVSFKQLNIFQDFKFSAVFKGYNEITMIQLHSLYSKYLNAEKKNVSNDDQDYTPFAFYKLNKCMNRYFKLISFESDKKKFSTRSFPVIIKPENEMSFEFLSEIISYGMQDSKSRLRESEYWNLVKQFSKKQNNFINFSKAFLSNTCRLFRDQVKKHLSELIAFKTKIKLQNNLDNLNQVSQNVTEHFYQYEDLLFKTEAFFEDDMYYFRRSLKDLIKLSDITYNEEKKILLNEYNKMVVMEGEEGGKEKAKAWLKEAKKARRKKFLENLANAWLKDDKHLQGFFNDILEYIYTAVAFAWNTSQGTPYSYRNFNYPLKSFLVLYSFLYELDDESKERQITEQISSLSNLANQELDVECMKNVSVNKNSTVPMFTKLRQNEDLTFKELFNILRDKMVNLISYFLSNEFIPQKKRWMQFMKLTIKDQKSFNSLDLEMKQNQLSAHAKYEAKRGGVLNQIDIHMNITQGQEWNDTLQTLIKLSGPRIVKTNFEVTILRSDGLDEGNGPILDWINFAIKDLMDIDKGLFTYSANGVTVQPSVNSCLVPNYLMHFEYAGRIIAKGLVDKINMNVDLTKGLLKQLLKQQLVLSDLEDIDPTEYKILKSLSPDGCNLPFTVDKIVLDQVQTVELVPGGRDILVTDLNVKKYVKLRSMWKLRDGIQAQIDAFIKGFYDVVPFRAIKFFDEKEFGLLLSGQKKIDVDEMRLYSNYNDYTHESDQVKWLFEILSESDEKTRSLFLYFVTGTFSLPVGGFKNFRITIGRVDHINRLPTAQTCLRLFELPIYQSKEILNEKLQLCIHEGGRDLQQ